MKALYSHILLLAFMIGALQPVTPMVQHLMLEGTLTEILTEAEGEICEGSHCDMGITVCTCEHQKADNDRLLDIDYYPLTLQMGEQPVPDRVNQKTCLCCSGDEQTIALHYQTDLPPPRKA